MTDNQPLVSIFCFCKNARSTIERCVNSVLNQTYGNIEFIVKDGGSTDGTLEFLDSLGPRIRLIIGPETSPQDAFFQALKLCKGEIIGSCLSDEELMPYAVDWAVSNLSLNQNCAAIFGDTYITDIYGKISYLKTGSSDFTFENYLSFKSHMEFVSIFFRKKHLESVGLYSRQWIDEVAEYELIARLALKYPIKHIPGAIGKYAYHKNALSQNYENVLAFAMSMENLIDDFCLNPDSKYRCLTHHAEFRSGLCLRVSRILISLSKHEEAKDFLKKSLEFSPEPTEYYKCKQEIIKHTEFAFNLKELTVLSRHICKMFCSLMNIIKKHTIIFLLSCSIINKLYLRMVS